MGAANGVPRFRPRYRETCRLYDPCDLCSLTPRYSPNSRTAQHWLTLAAIAAIESVRPMYKNSFLEAVATGNIDAMEEHIEKNLVSVMASRDDRGNSAAHVAAIHGRIHALELLVLHNPAMLRAQNFVRNEPVHVAAEAGQIEILKWLFDQVIHPGTCPSDLFAFDVYHFRHHVFHF